MRVLTRPGGGGPEGAEARGRWNVSEERGGAGPPPPGVMKLNLDEGESTVQAGLWSALRGACAEPSGLKSGLHRFNFCNLGDVSLTPSFCFVLSHL